MPRRARRSASRLTEKAQKSVVLRSKNPKYTIWGAGKSRSTKFGDGNLRSDAAVAEQHQRDLQAGFYMRLETGHHPRDREAA